MSLCDERREATKTDLPRLNKLSYVPTSFKKSIKFRLLHFAALNGFLRVNFQNALTYFIAVAVEVKRFSFVESQRSNKDFMKSFKNIFERLLLE